MTVTTSGTPSISGQTLPNGTFDLRHQLHGEDVAVLHLASLQVSPNAIIHVVGTRPLIVVVSGAIDIEGLVDASAKATVPGAGGAMPGTGDGAGTIGTHLGTYEDSGGGGDGFGTPAVPAVRSCAPGGAIVLQAPIVINNLSSALTPDEEVKWVSDSKRATDARAITPPALSKIVPWISASHGSSRSSSCSLDVRIAKVDDRYCAGQIRSLARAARADHRSTSNSAGSKDAQGWCRTRTH